MAEANDGGRVLLHCDDLDVAIGSVQVTHRFHLALRAGQCWCLLGRNGTGKTTLLRTLAGLHRPAGGRIRLDGEPLEALPRRTIARRLGILFQSHEDVFPATVLESVLTGRHPWLHAWQWESAADLQRAREALAFVELSGFEQRPLHTLSGGERRRAGIATLLTQDPGLLLLDEPTNHLDLHHRTRLLERLCDRARDRGQAVLMVLHDVNLAARLADHAVLLHGEGRACTGTTADVLTTANLEALYGHPLEQVQTRHGAAWLPA